MAIPSHQNLKANCIEHLSHISTLLMALFSSLTSAVPIFRQYTYDNSFLKVFTSSQFASEYQVSLVFARDDYDEEGSSNGNFLPRWNTDPSAIKKFKENLKESGVSVKVFISIGGRDSTYPFNPKDQNEWIENATKSLTNIIKNSEHDWEVDGIDIYYEHIKTDAQVFSQTVGEVIKNLKESKVITVASISPSDAVTPEYESLYKDYTSYIDWVDYQFQNEQKVVATADDLVSLYNEKANLFNKENLFAGYSAQNEDWGKVSPIVFFLAGGTLLQDGAPGASIYYHSFGD